MSPAEAQAILDAGRHTQAGQMLTWLVTASRTQSELVLWCLAVSNDDVLAVWGRAVAVLRLPEASGRAWLN